MGLSVRANARDFAHQFRFNNCDIPFCINEQNW